MTVELYVVLEGDRAHPDRRRPAGAAADVLAARAARQRPAGLQRHRGRRAVAGLRHAERGRQHAGDVARRRSPTCIPTGRRRCRRSCRHDRPAALHRASRRPTGCSSRTRSRCWSGSRSTSRCRCRRRSWGRTCCASGWASLVPAAVAAADLDPIFRERPAIHRFPGAMATPRARAGRARRRAVRRRRGAGLDDARRPPTSCATTSPACPATGR